MQPNGAPPSAATKFDVGQIWDLTFSLASGRKPPHVEDVIVTRWKQLASEPNLRAVLLERVTPWRGGLDQLFGGYLRKIMNTRNAFLSERDPFPHSSMGYWLPDAPLIKWTHEHDLPCYRYWTPTREAVIDYTGFTQQIFKIPEHTLIHVALVGLPYPVDGKPIEF